MTSTKDPLDFYTYLEMETLRTAFESSYDGIHILDGAGRTLYINKACERIEGICAEEAASCNIRDLVSAGIYSESVTLKVLEEKAPVTIIQKVKNGNEVLATGTPIYKDGKIDKVVVNSRDITELNSLKRELQEKAELAARYHHELELLRREQMEPAGMIVKSEAMMKIIRIARMAAKVDSTVLISGESGAGKGVLGKFIHENSLRSGGTFVKIDCSAIPETLFESELFGYEKGAFTGAAKDGKLGLLELAAGGTLFLDEIAEIPLNLQPKLLRTIQDREFLRIGGQELIPIDVRIVAATNRHLETMVEQGRFREDLYYRLNVIPIEVPPLRERPQDIYPLVLEMTKRVNERYGLHKKIGKKPLEILLKYRWPGNIRELENIVERMIVTAEGETVTLSEVPVGLLGIGLDGIASSVDSHLAYQSKLAEYDKQLLLEAIQEAGSVVRAAKLLGINVTTVRRKLDKYGITGRPI